MKMQFKFLQSIKISLIKGSLVFICHVLTMLFF